MNCIGAFAVTYSQRHLIRLVIFEQFDINTREAVEPLAMHMPKLVSSLSEGKYLVLNMRIRGPVTKTSEGL
jgi:hypothetical protein